MLSLERKDGAMLKITSFVLHHLGFSALSFLMSSCLENHCFIWIVSGMRVNLVPSYTFLAGSGSVCPLSRLPHLRRLCLDEN